MYVFSIQKIYTVESYYEYITPIHILIMCFQLFLPSKYLVMTFFDMHHTFSTQAAYGMDGVAAVEAAVLSPFPSRWG